MDEPINVLGPMVTPAVMISAAALLLLSTANRLGRVSDRLGGLMAEAGRLSSPEASTAAEQRKRELVAEQLASHLRRLLLLRSAVKGMYVTIALLAATGMAAGLHSVFTPISQWAAIALGLLGVFTFLYSILLLVRESSIAVRVTLNEITYVQRLLSQHGALHERQREAIHR